MEKEKKTFLENCPDLAKVYCIYDNQMNECKELLLFPTFEKAQSMFVELSSSVNSPYYQNAKSYDVYCIGSIDTENMAYIEQRSFIGNLSTFIDNERVKYQRVIQTLNFLPQGYFKMPKEMQEEIKNDIDNAVKTYVENYIDLDKLTVKNEVIKDE